MAILHRSSANTIPSRANRARSRFAPCGRRGDSMPDDFGNRRQCLTLSISAGSAEYHEIPEDRPRIRAAWHQAVWRPAALRTVPVHKRNAGSAERTLAAPAEPPEVAPLWFAASHTRTAGGQGGGWPTGPRARRPAGRPFARVPFCWPLRGLPFVSNGMRNPDRTPLTAPADRRRTSPIQVPAMAEARQSCG